MEGATGGDKPCQTTDEVLDASESCEIKEGAQTQRAAGLEQAAALHPSSHAHFDCQSTGHLGVSESVRLSNDWSLDSEDKGEMRLSLPEFSNRKRLSKHFTNEESSIFYYLK